MTRKRTIVLAERVEDVVVITPKTMHRARGLVAREVLATRDIAGQPGYRDLWEAIEPCIIATPEAKPMMPEIEKCWGCVQLVDHYPNPVPMSVLDDVQGRDIPLCDRHWSWWLGYWMSPETGEPGCASHVIIQPGPLPHTIHENGRER